MKHLLQRMFWGTYATERVPLTRRIKAWREGEIEWVNEWEHVWNTGSESKVISQTGLDKQSNPFICD